MKALRYLLSLLILTILPARAAVSSLAAPSVDRDAAVSYNQWLASSVSAISATEAMFVDSISIKLSCTSPNQYVFLAITGESAGRPDMNDIRVIADTAPLLEPVHLNSVVTFSVQPRTDNGPAVLTPGQWYWVVLGVSQPDWNEDLPAGLFHWSYAAAAGSTQAQAGWEVGSAVASGNTAGQNWSTESATPYSFSLQLTPVPEPSIAALAACSMLVYPRRRK